MLEANIKFVVKHEPADSPCSWHPSKLTLVMKADYNLVNRVERAVRIALAEGENL